MTENRFFAAARGPRLLCLLPLLLALLGGRAIAQEVLRITEHVDSDRPEAWAMNYFTSVTLLAGLSVPRSRKFGSIEVGGELGWIPALSERQRTVGFNGTKEEDLNKAPMFGRPRLIIGLPGDFALTLSYLPPVRIFGLKPNLFTFALERPVYESGPWTFGARLYGQIGKSEGAITCSGDVVDFPPGSDGNPYGCEEKSADVATQRYAGLELSGAYRIERWGGLTPYAAIAGNFLDTKVRLDALTFGLRNRTRLDSESWTFSASAGAAYPLNDRLTLSAGLFYTPLSVTRPPAGDSENDALFNVRALLTYKFN